MSISRQASSGSISALLTGSVILAGAGKMGGALLRGWLDHGIAAKRIVIFEPAPTADLMALVTQTGLRLNPRIETVADANLILLAVKPQSMAQALPNFLPLKQAGGVFLSIAAGKPVEFLEAVFGKQTPIVRAMPNLPASVGHGISVLYANAAVSAAQRDLSGALLGAVGQVAWVADEALLDPVTAVSGSGPAYVFLLIECLAKAGVSAGLDEELAMQLATATIMGSGQLAAQSDLPVATLRENVTSPGGTTAAALDILMREPGLQSLITEAVLAATNRSRELAK